MGLNWNSMGQWEIIWIVLGIIRGYWGIVGVHFELIGSSFLVHLKFVWGSFEVIGYLLGVQLRLICSFGGSLEVHI